MQCESEIGVFRQRLQTQSAGLIDRLLADRADRAWNNGDAVPARISAAIEIESARVLERLATRDECAQVADFGVTGNRADCFVAKRFYQQRKCVALKVRVRIDKHNDAVTNCPQRALQRARFPAIFLTEQTHSWIDIC